MNAKRELLMIGVAMIMAGCSSRESSVDSSTKAMVQTEIQSTVNEESTEETVTETGKTEQIVEINKEEKFSSDDNFSVDMEMVEEFAGNIKTAVMQKDLEALADLTAYPIYVRFPEGGKSIENREALIALGTDRIFTEVFIDSVSQADETNISPSRAGFVLKKESDAPNIVFGLRDGELAVSAINF